MLESVSHRVRIPSQGGESGYPTLHRKSENFCGCLVNRLLRKMGSVWDQHLGIQVEIAALPIIDIRAFERRAPDKKQGMSHA